MVAIEIAHGISRIEYAWSPTTLLVIAISAGLAVLVVLAFAALGDRFLVAMLVLAASMVVNTGVWVSNSSGAHQIVDLASGVLCLGALVVAGWKQPKAPWSDRRVWIIIAASLVILIGGISQIGVVGQTDGHVNLYPLLITTVIVNTGIGSGLALRAFRLRKSPA